MDKKQPPQKRPPKKERKRKKLRLDAAAIEEGRILGQQKAHAKKSLQESLKEHLGLIIDRVEPVDAIIYGGLAALGVEAAHGNWRGALVGPIGLKLALTDGTISQAVGCGILASLGLISAGAFGLPAGTVAPTQGTNAEERAKAVEEKREPNLEFNLAPLNDVWTNISGVHCNKGYVLDWDILHGWYCRPAKQPT